MLKFGDQWIPVCYGLLPSKSMESYKIFFFLIKKELAKRNLLMKMKKILCDFEIAIQKPVCHYGWTLE